MTPNGPTPDRNPWAQDAGAASGSPDPLAAAYDRLTAASALLTSRRELVLELGRLAYMEGCVQSMTMPFNGHEEDRRRWESSTAYRKLREFCAQPATYTER